MPVQTVVVQMMMSNEMSAKAKAKVITFIFQNSSKNVYTVDCNGVRDYLYLASRW